MVPDSAQQHTNGTANGNGRTQAQTDFSAWMAQIAGAVTTIAKRMTALEKHSDLSRKAVNLTHDDLAAVRARLNQLEKKIDALAAKSG